MTDDRNEYGFPIVDPAKLAEAQQYAAEVRQRTRLPCNCATCRQLEMLDAVRNVLAARRSK